MVEFANGVAGIPELRGDAAVAGIFEHADLFSAFDLPADFGGKLKLVAAVVDGPGAVCLHEDAILSVGDEIAVVPGAGEQTDVGHSNNGQAVPAFRAHGSGRAIQTDQVRGFAIRKIAAKFAVFDDVRALRGNAFVIVCKRAKALAVVEPRVGDDVHDARGVFEVVQLVERKKTCAGEIRFLAKDAIEFDGMADRFMNLQAELAVPGTAQRNAARRIPRR